MDLYKVWKLCLTPGSWLRVEEVYHEIAVLDADHGDEGVENVRRSIELV